MNSFEVTTDYINLKYQVQQNGKFIDIKLPAKLQAAMIQRVIDDVNDIIGLALESRMSDAPPGLAELTQ